MTNFSLKTTHFDFRKTRVRLSTDGLKWRLATKFDLSYYLCYIDFDRYFYCEHQCDYKHLKMFLLHELTKHQYSNVTIIC